MRFLLLLALLLAVGCESSQAPRPLYTQEVLQKGLNLDKDEYQSAVDYIYKFTPVRPCGKRAIECNINGCTVTNDELVWNGEGFDKFCQFINTPEFQISRLRKQIENMKK